MTASLLPASNVAPDPVLLLRAKRIPTTAFAPRVAASYWMFVRAESYARVSRSAWLESPQNACFELVPKTRPTSFCIAPPTGVSVVKQRTDFDCSSTAARSPKSSFGGGSFDPQSMRILLKYRDFLGNPEQTLIPPREQKAALRRRRNKKRVLLAELDKSAA